MFVRYLLTSGLGFTITLGLFFAMQALIASERPDDDEIPAIEIPLTMGLIDTPVQPGRVEPPDRPDTAVEPQVPRIAPPPRSRPEIGTGSPITPIDPRPVIGEPTLAGPVEGEALVIVRPAPQYPQRAIARQIEGWVLLEFTITRTGGVEDVRVVDSEPSAIFDDAAKRAVRRWKYKPKVENGVPVARTGVQVVVSFDLPE